MIRKGLSLLLLVAAVLALYNVYADDAQTQATAERLACGADPCVRLLRHERTPVSQSFVFQTKLAPPRTREVRCARRYWLVGAVKCSAAGAAPAG